MREIIKPALIVGMSAALLWVFWRIWLRGSHYVQEPNRLILTAETLMMVTILLFGLYEFIRVVTRRDH
jgi:hypothetical protein